MDQQVLERFTLDGHSQFGEPHTICLQHLSRIMHLFQHGNLIAMQSPPTGHPSLKGTQLPFLVLVWLLLTQPFE